MLSLYRKGVYVKGFCNKYTLSTYLKILEYSGWGIELTITLKSFSILVSFFFSKIFMNMPKSSKRKGNNALTVANFDFKLII